MAPFVTVLPATRFGWSGTVHETTDPDGIVSSNTGSPWTIARPMSVSVVVAWSSVMPFSSGSVRGAGPVLITIVSVLPSASSVPAAGSVRTTMPLATLSLGSCGVSVFQPDPDTSLSAAPWLMPVRSGTVCDTVRVNHHAVAPPTAASTRISGISHHRMLRRRRRPGSSGSGSS